MRWNAYTNRLRTTLLALVPGMIIPACADGFTPAQRALWSLQILAPSPPPAVQNTEWIRTPVDAFILGKLEDEHCKPGSPATKSTLLRRASLDLTGLPPSPEELSAFEFDTAPGAFDRAVERLLASPTYGERWARHWLDLARYAESEGFKADETRPNAWRYRDYVIRAFNVDKPYDRFIQEQIAGDEMWPDDPEALVATGFNRHYPDESNARNLMQRRQEILNDITDTVGSVFCGLTFACARCHDHKWDPIRQADYYRLQAFFANTAADDHIPLLPPEASRRYREQMTDWEDKTKAIREEMSRLEQPHREALIKDYVDKYPDNIQVALKKPATERTAFEQQMVAKAKLYLDPASHQYLAPPNACANRMKKADKERWQALKQDLEKYASLHPGKLPIGTGIREVAADAPPTFVLNRGNWNAPLEEVGPGFLDILSFPQRAPPGTKVASLAGLHASASAGTDASVNLATRPGRRTALANWLTDPANPLTARVMVNRIWHHHFGRGIAGTPSDLGLKGEAPTHPELLDWLANEFIRSGWSVKHMHRLIMRSAVYQQASTSGKPDPARATPAEALTGHASADPENRLLGRFPRHRLEGETIRDAALSVAGRLNSEQSGPSVFPELPGGMESRGGWKVSDNPSERDRRSVYVFVRRNTRYPMFETFDMPDTHEPCARRNVTTSPTQALTLLNSRLTHEWAADFAERVLAEAGADERRQIGAAWTLAFARHPDSEELRLTGRFLEGQRRIVAERRASGELVSLPFRVPGGVDRDQAAALVDLCHALLNSNEFVYVD